jgi:serine phosphatase RsbU (regulator of sigma subunit)
LTEAFNADGEEFGEARLLDTLSTHASASPAAICHTLLDAARDHAHGVAGDDATVLALRRTREP